MKKRAWMAKVNSRVTTDPASMPWMDALLGMYRNPELGSAQLIKKEERYWIQFEEWASALGSETRYDGVRLLHLTTHPWYGGQILVADTGELILDAGQVNYVFRKQ